MMKQYRGDLLPHLREGLNGNKYPNNLKWVDKKEDIFSVYLPDVRKGKVLEQDEKILEDWCNIRNMVYTVVKYSRAKNNYQNALKRSDRLVLLKRTTDEIILRFANEQEVKEKKRMKKEGISPLTVDSKLVDTPSPASSGYHTGEDPDHNEMDAYDADAPLFTAPNSENFDLIHDIDSAVNTPFTNDAVMDVEENPGDLITHMYSPLITASENEDNIFFQPNGYIPDFDDLINEDQTPFKKLFASTESLNQLEDSDVLPEHQSSVQPEVAINVYEKFYWHFSEKLSYGIFTILIFIKQFVENDSEAERKAYVPLGVWEPGLIYDYELEVEDKLYVYLKPHNI